MNSYLARLAGLHRRIRELESHVDDLETALGVTLIAPHLTIGLAAAERRVLGALVTHSLVTTQMAALAIHQDHTKEDYSDKLVHVRMHYVRKFLKTRNIHLHNVQREGWYLAPADRQMLRNALAANIDGGVAVLKST